MIGCSAHHLGRMLRQAIDEKSLPEKLLGANGKFSIPEKYLDEVTLYVQNNTYKGGRP